MLLLDEVAEAPESTTLATAALAAACEAWPMALCCFWRLLLFCSERRLICLSILRTQVGKVLDQKDTYDWAVSGGLTTLAEGDEAAEAMAALAAAAAAPDAAWLASDAAVDGEPEGEAAWATWLAPLTSELAAEMALMSVGGFAAKRAASAFGLRGEGAEGEAGATGLEAGTMDLVCTYTSRNLRKKSTNPLSNMPGGATDDEVPARGRGERLVSVSSVSRSGNRSSRRRKVQLWYANIASGHEMQ